jgi:hypothetical protein
MIARRASSSGVKPEEEAEADEEEAEADEEAEEDSPCTGTGAAPAIPLGACLSVPPEACRGRPHSRSLMINGVHPGIALTRSSIAAHSAAERVADVALARLRVLLLLAVTGCAATTDA